MAFNWTVVIAPTLSGIGIITIVILTLFCFARRVQSIWTLYTFPKRSIPFQLDLIQSERLFNKISKETEENSKVIPEPPEQPLHKGWIKINNHLINLKQFISNTPEIIEKPITCFNSNLTRLPNQTFRDYLENVKGKLKDQLPFDKVLLLYEKARFGDQEITKEEYDEYIKNIYTILDYFEKNQQISL